MIDDLRQPLPRKMMKNDSLKDFSISQEPRLDARNFRGPFFKRVNFFASRLALTEFLRGIRCGTFSSCSSIILMLKYDGNFSDVWDG